MYGKGDRQLAVTSAWYTNIQWFLKQIEKTA